MSGAKVKAALSDGGFALKNWEVPCQSNLTEIIDAVKHLKQSLNDYLSELIDCGVKDQIDVVDASDQEEETDSDSVSGFIKGIGVVNEKHLGCEKRKINYVFQSKKIKK